MDNQNNIQDELRNLDSSLPFKNSQPSFSVPDGYFDRLADSILAKVKEQQVTAADELRELSPLLAGLSRQMPYTVPPGYFADNITALPFLLEDESSPVLAAIGHQLPYRVPENYFKNLPEQILAKVDKPEAKVISMFARTWMRVAVAAAISGIVLFGGYRLLNDADSEQPLATNKAIDSTDKMVAKNETKAAVQEMNDVSTEEMDAFIRMVPINPAKLQNSSANSTQKKDVSELLKDVSEKEIDVFLEQIPTADDDLQVID